MKYYNKLYDNVCEAEKILASCRENIFLDVKRNKKDIIEGINKAKILVTEAELLLNEAPAKDLPDRKTPGLL